MGYKSADDVNVTIYELGPAENIAYSGSLGNFAQLTSKDVKVNFSIPERNLKPGTYSITPFVTSSSTIRANVKELNYSIPAPKMQINPVAIDFGKITFETGKDTEKVILNISETGGYTPIEKLSVSLVNGEEDWITHLDIDYIPAGKSESYSFVIFLPPDASLGLKSWDFKLDTSYAGSKDIYATVIVSFPGTDEAIASLKNMSSVTDSTEKENLIRDTISLLEKSKDKTQLRKIAMVMSVYSGTRTFLNNLGTAANSGGKLVEAGDAVIRAKAALNKMEIGDQNLKDAELKLYSSKIVSSAKHIWGSETGSTLSSLEESAENERDSNYKLTALYYNRISEIYRTLDNPPNAEKYSEKQNDIEKLYHNSLLEASTLAHAADSGLDSAREKTFSPGEDTYIVLNPFSYDFVSGSYDDAIDKYEQAEALYRRAGEDSDADLLKDKLEEMTRQRNNTYRAFLVYGSFLGLIFLWFVGRVIWGLQHYTQDEMDGRWGDVITEGEAITGEKAEVK
jgi:tetratricopeptide (TPR) repeat protein